MRGGLGLGRGLQVVGEGGVHVLSIYLSISLSLYLSIYLSLYHVPEDALDGRGLRRVRSRRAQRRELSGVLVRLGQRDDEGVEGREGRGELGLARAVDRLLAQGHAAGRLLENRDGGLEGSDSLLGLHLLGDVGRVLLRPDVGGLLLGLLVLLDVL